MSLNIRTLFVKRYYFTILNMFKLTELMSLRNLVTFIFKAFDERNRILYTNSDKTMCSSTVAIVVV